MLAGGSMLNWQPDLGTKIALVPRSGDGPVSFAELEPFWVWHFANAYEDGDRVVADVPGWSALSLAAGDRRAADGQQAPVRGRLSRVSIDPARGAATVTHVSDQPSEFPRIDDRLTGRRHRYLTVGAASGEHDLARGEHDRLIRWDMSTGHSQAWDTDASIGEVVFVPRDGAAEELDGYYRAGRLCRSRQVPRHRHRRVVSPDPQPEPFREGMGELAAAAVIAPFGPHTVGQGDVVCRPPVEPKLIQRAGLFCGLACCCLSHGDASRSRVPARIPVVNRAVNVGWKKIARNCPD